MIIVANVASEHATNPELDSNFVKIKELADKKNIKLVPLSVEIETEISFLNEEEKEMFLSEYNLTASGLDNLIRTAFDNLNLATYFTVGIRETRA